MLCYLLISVKLCLIPFWKADSQNHLNQNIKCSLHFCSSLIQQLKFSVQGDFSNLVPLIFKEADAFRESWLIMLLRRQIPFCGQNLVVHWAYWIVWLTWKQKFQYLVFSFNIRLCLKHNIISFSSKAGRRERNQKNSEETFIKPMFVTTCSCLTMKVMSSPGLRVRLSPLMLIWSPLGAINGHICCAKFCCRSTPPSHTLETTFLYLQKQ